MGAAGVFAEVQLVGGRGGVTRKSGLCVIRFVEQDERSKVIVGSRVGGGVGSVGERKQVEARDGESVGAVALELVLKDCGGQ